MRAAVYRRYGPPEVIRIENVGKPIPKDNEVLVRVRATTVCTTDWRLRKADPFLVRFMNGLPKPKKTLILARISHQILGRTVLAVRFRRILTRYDNGLLSKG